MRSAGMVTVATVVMVVGCSHHHTRTGTASSSPSVRDSSGVEIVEDARPEWAGPSHWHVSAGSEVEIGRRDGPAPYILDRVTAALRLTDGRIVLGDAGSSQVRFYDSTGTFLNAAGQKGQGPGEFQYIQSVWRGPEDSLFVFDGRGGRISVLSPGGVYVRMVHLEIPPGDRGIPVPFGLTQSGDLLATSATGSDIHSHRDGLLRGATTYLERFSPGGHFENQIAVFPGSPYWGFSSGGMYMTEYLPFSNGWLLYAWSPTRVYAGSGNEAEIRAFAPTGNTLRVIRWKAGRQPVTAELRADFKRGVLEHLPFPPRKEYWARWVNAVPFPDRLPVYGVLKVATDGDLWVQRYQPSWLHEPTRWLVFDPDGHWVGNATTPPDLRITDIGRDYLLGVHRDTLGIEQVQLYPLLTND